MNDLNFYSLLVKRHKLNQRLRILLVILLLYLVSLCAVTTKKVVTDALLILQKSNKSSHLLCGSSLCWGKVTTLTLQANNSGSRSVFLQSS